MSNTPSVVINRIKQEDCTIGILNYLDFRCFTLELPDLNNTPNKSCIPVGTYYGEKIHSPSLGNCIDICNVTGRTFIRIHAGNYTKQIQGCVLVGDSLKDINNDGIIDIVNSKSTLEKLLKVLPESFTIQIRE